MSFMHLLNSNNFQIYNRHVAKILGNIHAAILISELINRYEYHTTHGDDIIIEGDRIWFYYTIQMAEDRLCMSREEQDSAIKILIKNGLIEKTQKGMPSKRYFCINEDKINNKFSKSNNLSRMCESHNLDCVNPTNSIVEIPQPAPIYGNDIKNSIKNSIKTVCSEDPPVCDSPPVCSATAPVAPARSKITSIVKGNFEGSTHEIKLDELFTQSVMRRKDWTSEEIHVAWKILDEYNGSVRDFYQFIEGTIRNIRNKKQFDAINKKGSKKCKVKSTNKIKSSLTKNDSSEKEEGEPLSQKLVCLRDILPQFKNGSRTQKDS